MSCLAAATGAGWLTTRGRAAQSCRTSPASTATVAATATQVSTWPNRLIPELPATWPTVKLQAAYMPSGNTVAQRRRSYRR